MTRAILVATAPAAASEGPAALLRAGGTTLLARFAGQLAASGVTDVVVVTRPEWVPACKDALSDDHPDVRQASDLSECMATIAEAAAGRGPLIVARPDVLTHGAAVRSALTDPRAETGIFVRGMRRQLGRRAPGWGVRVERGRVVTAESPFHQVSRPNARFLGLVRVGADVRDRFVETVGRLARLCREGLPPEWEPELARKVGAWGREFFSEAAPAMDLAGELEHREGAPWLPDPRTLRAEVAEEFERVVVKRGEAAREDAVTVILTALVRSDVTLRCTYLRQFYWSQPSSQPEAEIAGEEMERLDEDRILLDAAVKGKDGFFATFFCSPYTKYIARAAARRGIRPNQVTVFSFALGLATAAAFSRGSRPWLIAGAVLLYLTFAFDCVDGQLARYSKRFTALGAWLDPMFDRAKEYAVYAALAYGAVARGANPDRLWLLATATLALQALRHHMDFAYAAGRQQLVASIARPPIELPWDSPLLAAEDEPEEGEDRQSYPTVYDTVEDAVDDTAEEMSDDPALPAAAKRSPRSADDTDEPSEPLEIVTYDDETEEGDGPSDDRPPVLVSEGGTAVAALRRVGATSIRLSRRAEKRPWVRWAKLIIAFPIGERYAAIALTAALAGAQTVFVVMLAWGTFALVYTVTGRIFRSII